MGTNRRGRVQTAKTVFGIVEALHELDGARISELADHLGLARSTVHRHLTTLHDQEYVIKEEDTYLLGLQFLNLGAYTRNRREEYRMARSKVEELADITDERAQFIVEEHGYAVYVHRERGGHGVQTDPGIGKRIPLHATAAGKAILATVAEERLTTILDRRGLAEITDNTITDHETLFEELESIRDQGHSFNLEENVEGLHAVGVPIRGSDGDVLGALSVSGPAHRLKGEWLETELPDLLLGAANELELNIAHGQS